MIFIDQMKDLKIYKKSIYLPTADEYNKKTKSAILLLTPNYESSKKLISSSMIINRKRYQSYYIERDLSYYISGKVMKEIPVEESYIREANTFGDQTDKTGIDSLYDYIKFSGYEKDIKEFESTITSRVYFDTLKFFEIKPASMEDIPVLNFTIAGNTDDINFTETTTPERIDFFFTIPIGYEKTKVLNALYIALVEHFYPKTKGTILPRILCDYCGCIDTLYSNEYGRYIFEDNEVNIPQYLDICRRGAYNEIVNLLKTKYPDINISDICEAYVIEGKSSPITMTNLNDKFKYLSTTKVKKQMSQKVNGTARLIKQIKDNIKTVTDTTPNNYNYATADPEAAKEDKERGIDDNADQPDTIKEAFIDELDESEYVRSDDMITFFVNESSSTKYNSQLRSLLYKERMTKRAELLNLYTTVKADLPDIKYAYPDLNRYQQKNLFVDLYFYNQTFFKNNTWAKKKGYDLYLELLDRLINDPRLKSNGYSKKTIFIPVLDWDKSKDTRMWLYNEDINPISIIYEMMRTNSAKITSIFGKTDLIFFGNGSLFKLNFSQIEDPKKVQFTFKNFIDRMTKNMEFDDSDIDTTLDNETPRAIKTNIYDAIDVSKDVDLTGKELVKTSDIIGKPAKKLNADTVQVRKYDVKPNGNIVPTKTVVDVKVDTTETDTTIDKQAKREKKVDKDIDEKELEALAHSIDMVANNSESTDDAYDLMDDDESIKNMLIDIDNMKSDTVKIDASRTARMNKLDQQFLDSTIKDRTVRDILADETSLVDKPLRVTDAKVASPNPEWKNLTYMNFDKDYNLYSDIVACFYHFTKVSKPISIRKLTVDDHTTSEDRLDLYTAEMEDFRGKRFTVKLDIPKPKDNRFLLRGNTKAIQNQLFNMPIIKTDFNACQVISNYQKVFVYRVNTTIGKSSPVAGKFVKALSKYTGNSIKVTYGNNTKVSNKYELPIDYIDLAQVINKIEYKTTTVYFNQDEIRLDHPDIDESKGMPYAYDTKIKAIYYYDIPEGGTYTFVNQLYDVLQSDDDFVQAFNSSKPSVSGTYSSCSILSARIPLAIVCGYCEGLSTTLKKAKIDYHFTEKLTPEDKSIDYDHIKFSDGYLVYRSGYISTMLMNGLANCPCDLYPMSDVDNRNFYLEMLDDYGGRIKSDGLDNFYDCLVDPMIEENLKYYNLPTDFVSIMLYANALLSDNKYTKHTDSTSRRLRRTEMVAAYTYESLAEAYGAYANMIKHNKANAIFSIKSSAVIDKMMLSPIVRDDSVITALNAVETTNAVTYKGKAGLNNDRSYSIDKRTYDDSMLNVIGMSTGFSGNVGITRQATMDMNIEGARGYVKSIDGDTSKMNTAKTLCATEALTPFGTTRDDGNRTDMTFVQTAKHMLRTEQSDPLLVTNGADEALAYMTTDKFAFKAKDKGKVIELTDDMMIVEYDNRTRDYINLKETVEKNSDGGFFVPLKLDATKGLKVGSKFENGEILAYDKLSFSNSVGESDNIAYNIGKLVKVAVINTDEGYEDSGVCTEGLSDKLAARVVEKVEHTIDKDANVFSIVKIGDEVKVDQSLIVWQDPHDEEEANTLLKMMGDDQEAVSELGRKTLKSPVTGKVTDIKIFRTVELSELSESLQKIVGSYERPINALKNTLKKNNIPYQDLPATYKLEPTGKLKKAQEAIYIEFYVEYRDIIAIGDKITYYSANKAVIKNVIPEELAPYTDFRPKEPVDALISVTSIDKRMVTSTLVYGSIQKALVEADRSIKDMLGIKYDETQA